MQDGQRGAYPARYGAVHVSDPPSRGQADCLREPCGVADLPLASREVDSPYRRRTTVSGDCKGSCRVMFIQRCARRTDDKHKNKQEDRSIQGR